MWIHPFKVMIFNKTAFHAAFLLLKSLLRGQSVITLKHVSIKLSSLFHICNSQYWSWPILPTQDK